MPEETHHLFTTLGLSGSGKTCFMAGMYYKMSAGADGYTLKTGDDEALKLTSYYEAAQSVFRKLQIRVRTIPLNYNTCIKPSKLFNGLIIPAVYCEIKTAAMQKNIKS